ncbi:MAG: dihydropteroate synthase [Bacteroidota bacterium]|nr:dihydropteroate synthase [Bacteroidota bacterium]MDP4212640.1 dihydropteroate synthase [Bacteroidota bacterium]MDP4251584.1 dihydropteroate synthase [Bacteroidota bacterium]
MYTFNCKGRLLTWDQPILMGIVNVTPDSFYSGSRIQTPDVLLAAAEKMLRDGAKILDVGGMSSRPAALEIPVEEELNRVVPAIEAIAGNFPKAFISVDSYRPAVVEKAIHAGACMINDVSGGKEPAMIDLAAQHKVPYICMHMRGTPQTMQKLNHYDDLVRDVLDYFIRRKSEYLRRGLKDLVIDPGFGFAKNHAQNFQLLKRLSVLSMLNLPVMAGLSRKSSIYRTLGTSPDEALNGTTVLNTLALQNGASILRVHDVKEADEAIRLWTSYAKA